MRALRIAHLADTHLGYRTGSVRGRDEDFARAWSNACRAIVESKPDLILHAGDVFHHPNPSWSAVVDFLEGAAILRDAGCPIFLISGNHDSARVLQKRTIFNLLEDTCHHMIICHDDKPQIHRIAELDTEVVLLSHRALVNLQLEDNLVDCVAELSDDGYKILVSHGSVGDLTTYREMGSVVIPDFVFDFPWSYIALGHLHMAQPYGQRGWYSGSIERCGWSDYAASPAWTYTKLEGDRIHHEQHELPHLRFLDLPDLDGSTLSDKEIAERIQEMVERNATRERVLLRVKITGVNHYRQRLISNAARKLLQPIYPDAVLQVRVEGMHRIFDGEWSIAGFDTSKSAEEMFREFVASRVYETPTFGEMFLGRGLEVILQTEQELAERDAASDA